MSVVGDKEPPDAITETELDTISAASPVTPQSSSNNPRLHQSLRLWISPFTRFHQIPVANRLCMYLFLMAIYTVIVRWFREESFPTQVFKDLGSASYIGVMMGLLLVFRTNAAYERWYEGRKLWGQLMNDTRNLCLKVKAFVPVAASEKVRLGELLVSFAFALKHHLRDSRPTRVIPGTESAKSNVPVSIAAQIFNMVQHWHQKGNIDGFTRLQLDQHVRACMDILGACERIRSTPLAVSYRAFLRQGIVLNLLALPWYVTRDVSMLATLPLILIGSYFMIGLELIAEDIEDPFGYDGDDLPLDNICASIQKTVMEILEIPQQQFTSSVHIPRVDPLKPKS